MRNETAASMTVDAEIRTPAALVRVVRFQLPQPADNLLRNDDSYWLDLSLTPRPTNTRACFRDRWNPQRYEHVGKVFLLPPQETLRARSDAATSQMSVLCLLKPEAIRQWCGRDLQWTDHRLKASLDIRNPTVRALLLRAAAEARHPGFASTVLMETLLGQLAIELFRHCEQASDTAAGGGLAPWRLRAIDERLREVRASPTLTELAGLCRLSVRQLTRGFRSSRGCSIGDYVANARIEQAKHLLLADESVKAIAYSLGFASPSSFCFAFRRSTGVTPREFRQRVPQLTVSAA